MAGDSLPPPRCRASAQTNLLVRGAPGAGAPIGGGLVGLRSLLAERGCLSTVESRPLGPSHEV